MTTVREIGSLLFGRLRPHDGVFSVITAYFDDSGTHAGSSVTLMGGLVGREAQWEAFETAWAACLKNPTRDRGPIKRFHMFDCENHLGEFEGWNRADSDSAIYNFRKVMLDCELFGYVIGVETVAWDKLCVGPYRVAFGDAERFCLSTCILRTAQLVVGLNEDRDVKIVFDNRPEKNASHRKVMDIFQRYHVIQPELPNMNDFAFLSSSACLPLQGADLVANEYYRFLVELLKSGKEAITPRVHWMRLHETGRFAGDYVFEKQARNMMENAHLAGVESIKALGLD